MAGGVDLIRVFGADVMVEKIVEKVARNGREVFDALLGMQIEACREAGGSVV